MRAQKRGFTLIELLVVIAIIGMLSSIVLASLNSARAKARDAVRKQDLHTIQTALELYYSNCGSYVVSSGCAGTAYGYSGYGWFNYDYGTGSVGAGIKNNGLTGKEIVDPSGAISDVTAYMIFTDASRYTVWATIENPTAADTATLSSCYFSLYDNYMGPAAQNYCVSN